MYQIHTGQEGKLNYVKLISSDETAFAKISLDQGAALTVLTLNKQPVIVDLDPLSYENTYASSILFPFANRIKDGKYSYKGTEYHFNCNEVSNNNALHGLVFDQTFNIIHSETTAEKAVITLEYKALTKNKAFPYLYTVIVTYTLTDSELDLQLEVINNDEETFPFTVGWHPYFLSENLHESSIEFSAIKQYEFDERMITKSTYDYKNSAPFLVKDQQLDHCFALENGQVVFNTPTYKMFLNSTAKEPFFQVYTPPKKNVIALEPVTGISDSFNNKVGLQELESKGKYVVQWSLQVDQPELD